MGADIKKYYSQSLLDFAVGKQSRAVTSLTFGKYEYTRGSRPGCLAFWEYRCYYGCCIFVSYPVTVIRAVVAAVLDMQYSRESFR